MSKKPDCSKWKVWTGIEIEGDAMDRERGQETLFIRDGDWRSFNHLGINRIWFCKEFTDTDSIRAACKASKRVCIEVTPETLAKMPMDICQMSRLYLKLSTTKLKAGDTLCVGRAFSDEFHQIGRGRKVTPKEYAKDKFIA